MKVIFLDIDGVLNDARTIIKTGSDSPCQPHLGFLKQIVEATDAKIILTSTWRLFPSTTRIVVDGLKSVGLSFIDKTKDLASREAEIQTWLEEHPDVDKYVILDDELITPSHQVLTDFQDGLQLDHIKQAIEILTK